MADLHLARHAHDTDRFDPASGMGAVAFTAEGLEAVRVYPGRQTLVSGPRATVLSALGMGRAAEWPEVVRATPCALSLRRDRVLSVEGPALADGWHADHGIAVSDMTDGYAVLEIAGPSALALLNRATELDPELPSSGLVRRLWGIDAVVCRWQEEDRFRLHAALPAFPALAGRLARAADLMER